MRRWHLASATGAVCLVLLVAVMAAGSPPKGGAGYSGQTSQGKPIRFRVTPQGNLIRRFQVSRNLLCRKGRRRTALTGSFTQQSLRMRVGEKGRFHAEGNVEGRKGSRIRGGQLCLRGSFSGGGRVARGRYREVVRLRDGSLCRSGLLRFLARTSG